MKKIKKIIIAFTMVLSILAPSILLSNGVAVQAATIKLNKNSITLVVGKTQTLIVSGTKQTASWKSNNKKIATVSSKGVVKAVTVGSAKITATVGKTNLTCSVTVKKDPKPTQAAVKDVTMELQGYTLTYPDNYVVTAKDIAADGSITHYVYLSLASDPDKYLARIYMKKSTIGWDPIKAFLKPKMDQTLISPGLIQTYSLSNITISDIVVSDYDADFLKGAMKTEFSYKAEGKSGKGILYLGMIGDQLYQADVIDDNADVMKVVEKWYNSAKK
jgi:hypothetical protein